MVVQHLFALRNSEHKLFLTDQPRNPVVFVLQEGLDDIVLDTDLIPSEAEEHVKPILSNIIGLKRYLIWLAG
jgi:hypothetical protein